MATYDRPQAEVMTSFEQLEAKHVVRFQESVQRLSAVNTARAANWIGINPESDYFDECGPRYVLPERALSDISPKLWKLCRNDAQLYEHRLALLVDCAIIMAEVPVPEWSAKDRILSLFFQQYLQFLHREDDRIVRAVASIQGARANFHNDGADYPIEGYKLRRLFSAVRGLGFGDSLIDFMEAAAKMCREEELDQVIASGPEYLRFFREAGLEHRIPIYLAIWKASINSTTVLNPLDPMTIEHFQRLEAVGRGSDLAFRFVQSYFEGPVADGAFLHSLSHLTAQVLKCLGSEQRASAIEQLRIAVSLNEMRLDGCRYLEQADQVGAHHRNYLQYAVDIASFSRRTANLFLSCGLQIFKLGDEERALVLQRGRYFAETYGDDASYYFHGAVMVMWTRPQLFDRWAQALDTFGRLEPRQLTTFTDASVRALQRGSFEQFCCTAFEFAAELGALRRARPELRKSEERVSGSCGDDPMYSLLFKYFEPQHRAAAESVVLRGNSLEYARDLLDAYRNKQLHAFAGAIPAVLAGVYYREFRSMLGLISHYPWVNRPELLLRADLNASNSFAQKVSSLQTQQRLMLTEFRNGNPPGEWEADFRRRLALRFGPAEIDSLDSAAVVSLQVLSGSRFPRAKVDGLVSYLALRDRLPKIFPLGKEYRRLDISEDPQRELALSVRTQRGVLHDALDDLLPRPPYLDGSRGLEERLVNRLLDEEHGLLYFYHDYGSGVRVPVGHARFILLKFSNDDRQLLYVDEIAVQQKIEQTPFADWAPAVHGSILELARDCGAQALLYLDRNPPPPTRPFIEFLHDDCRGIGRVVEVRRSERSRLLDSFLGNSVETLLAMCADRDIANELLFEGSEEEGLLRSGIARNYALGLAGLMDPMGVVVNDTYGTREVQIFHPERVSGLFFPVG